MLIRTVRRIGLRHLKICEQTESEQRGKNRKKQSYDRCDTQQLEGEAQDKNKRVTLVSRVTKLVPARAYKERTESKPRRKASLILISVLLALGSRDNNFVVFENPIIFRWKFVKL